MEMKTYNKPNDQNTVFNYFKTKKLYCTEIENLKRQLKFNHSEKNAHIYYKNN